MGLALAAALFAVAVQRHVWPHYSGDADEFVYRLQARMLLDRHLTLSPATQNPFFSPWLSGVHNGRVVMPFTWPWPVVLAASQAMFGTMLVAVAAASAAASTFCYLLAREALRERRRALLACVLFTFTPFVLMLSGTYLNYMFALAIQLCFGWLVLRGLRVGSRFSWITAGAMWGLLTFTRPYDGILAIIPYAAITVVAQRRRLAQLARSSISFAIGAVPVVALTLVANVATTGSALTFPTTAQSGGAAKFFWGPRSVIPGGSGTIDFSIGKAVSSLGENLWALPTWMLGTYVALALAVLGAARLARERPRETALLVGTLLVFPLGYLAWFASALTVRGAVDGLGPHYYLPVVAPLAIFTACGVVALWERRGVLIPVAAIAAVVLTAVALRPKLMLEKFVRDTNGEYVREVSQGLRPWDGTGTLVVLERFEPSGIGQKWQDLVNPPDLEARTLYALDRGADEVDLLRRYPHRTAVRIVQRYQAGDDIKHLRLALKPMSVVGGRAVAFETRIVNTSGRSTVTAYLSQGRRATSAVLDTASVRNKVYDVAWVVSSDGAVRFNGPTAAPTKGTTRLSRTGTLSIGFSTADRPGVVDPDGVERRYYYRLRSGRVEVLTADKEWVRFGAPVSGWLPVRIDAQLTVRPRPS